MHPPSLYFFIINLILWLLPGITLAQPVILTDGKDKILASPYLSWLADPIGNLTIEQVSSPEFSERFLLSEIDQCDGLHRQIPGYVCWIRLEIQQIDSNDWHLISDMPSLIRIDAFIVDHTNQRIQTFGHLRWENHWQRAPGIKLPARQDNTYQIYLRTPSPLVRTRKNLALQLVSADALNQKIAHDYLIYGGIIISLLVLAAYNLFLFGSLRNLSYLALVLLLVSLALVLQRTYNVIPWLSFASNTASFWFTGSLQLLLFSCIQFWRQLLNTKVLMPGIDKISTALSLLLLGMIPFIHWPDGVFWSACMIVLTALFCIIAGVMAIRLTPRIMRSIAPGVIVFVGSSAPITLSLLGLLPDTDFVLLNDIFAFGSLAAGVLLSLTLAEHTRQIRIRAEQAITENRVKDEFLTTMSHELRTPINSVVATAELLKQSQLPAREQEYVSRLETASRHMLGLITDILDLSRLQLAKVTLNDEVFQLSTLLDHLKQMLQASAAEKYLILYLQPSTTPNLHLRGDPQRLSQILLNLLGNAIKFTEQGSVTLHVRETGGIDDGSIHLHFDVADTGIGITPEDQARLFQPFTQVDSQRTRHYGGSGLGLAISHKLVESMGGKLELDSTQGKGSRFFFTLVFSVAEETPSSLPLSGRGQDVSATAVQERPIPDKSGEGASRILLVDDDEMNRFFGRELLTRLGAETSIAGSGTEAIQQLQQHHFDLIFMDVSMPGMDGYETTRKIRATPRFADLPIIALTAHAIAGEKERCLAAGMNDYLTKPFTMAEMQTMLGRWTNARNAC